MIKANFNSYKSYVTDSLYQWDLNQVLTVTGLNLTVVPEVHFYNRNTERAIPRQATMTNHVVSVDIPNSLLQDPLTIYAHIGIYEGKTFKVVELVEIPVTPRERPSDYRIQDTDEEIYSFKKLENALVNKADNTRVDNIIAHNNDTEGNTELLDIRTDIDGKVHASAGTAVREQIKKIKKENVYGSVFLNKDYTFTFVQGNYIELTLNGNTEIFCNGTVYTVTDVHTRYTIEGTSTLFVVVFNYKTNSIAIQYFRNAVPENSVIIGTIYQSVLKLNIYGHHVWNTTGIDSHVPEDMPVWCNDVPTVIIENIDNGYKLILHMPYCVTNIGHAKFAINARTIEFETTNFGVYNILYNRLTDDMVIDHRGGAIRDNYFHIGCISMISGSVYMNNSVYFQYSNNLAIAPLILGGGNKFVEFDSVNKTVTFPDDTLILDNKNNNSKKYYQLTNRAGNTSISYAEYDSTAIVIYFDTFNKSLNVGTYLSTLSNKHIAIATMRVNNGQVSINAPYKWDGKPFNMDISDFGIKLSDIADFENDFMVKSINHRGYCTEAPENTLSAYKLSKKKGFDYVECDVSFTSDGVPVLVHDATIDRTSNGTGNINELTFDEVRALDFGSWFSSNYTGEKIPKFDEFILLCRNLGLHPYIEIKSSATYTQTQIETLVNIVKRAGMSDKVSWISFNATYLEYVKNVNSKARLGYVVDTVTETVISKATALKTEDNDVFIDSNYGTLTDDLVTLCVNADLPLEVWTVNNEASITSLNCYVSGVTSDNLIAGRTLMEVNLN